MPKQIPRFILARGGIHPPDVGFKELYERQKNERCDKIPFIIHDGPPYANGDPHLGHAVNKILKDFICKYQIQRGNRVEFVPGWDCHGLPIELRASSSTSITNPISIRTDALKFALATMNTQKEVFKRWGVTSDWKNPYLTCNSGYIEHELRSFYHLYSKGLVYRDRLPVFWSLCHKTALAEAELEYNTEHESTAAYVKFPIRSSGREELSALIWTSTPWTLLSNQSIGYSSGVKYSVVQCGDDRLVIASNLLDILSIALGKEVKLIDDFPADRFKAVKYMNPFKSGDFNFIECAFVTEDKGTGLVHLAPNHGRDDYVACLRHNITPEELLVDESGCFTSSAGPRLASKPVLSEGNKEMLQLFSDYVLKQEQLIHSYPYDWRSKKPVIIRSSQQWFFDIQQLKTMCMELLNDVKFIPQEASKHLERQLLDRPYWCISRQRSWGVPIPVFYQSDDKEKKTAIFNESILESVIDRFKKCGVSSWWTSQVSDLIRSDSSQVDPENLVKSNDILDIWFDSGMSWLPVIPKLNGKRVADIYLEGIDQFNGWFLSSLITSTAVQGSTPFKSVYVHGFVLDAEGKKMSKSLGNVVDPVDIVNGNKERKLEPFGADILRFWVLDEANTHKNVRFDPKDMLRTKDFVFKIRRLLRFCIGSLDDFDETKCLEVEELLMTEKVMVNYLFKYQTQFQCSMKDLNFVQVSALIHSLIEDLSSFYLLSCKNRLYCSPRCSRERRSVQTVLFHVIRILLQDLSFVLPHLCQDTYSHVTQMKLFSEIPKTSIYEVDWFDIPDDWSDEKMQELFEVVSSLRDQVNKALYASTKPKSNYNVNISVLSNYRSILENFRSEKCEVDQLSDILDVAQVKLDVLSEAEQDELEATGSGDAQKLLVKITFSESDMCLCPRCRRYTALKEDLCDRCKNCIQNIDENV